MKERGYTPEICFNIATGELIIGAAALDQRLQAGEHAADIRPLRDVLLGEKPQPTEVFPALDVRDFTTQDYINMTHWLGNVVIGPETRFNEEIFERAYRLGIGPSQKRLNRLEGGVSRLYEEAKLPNAYKRGLYDDWPRAKFVHYVGKVAAKTPASESIRDRISKLAKSGKGPSLKVVNRRVGSLSEAINLAGYFYSYGLSDDDYYDWGVRFTRANDGRLPDTDALDYLSPKRLAPARTSITSRFGSQDSFRDVVDDIYRSEIEQITNRNKTRFEAIMQMLADDILPTRLFVGTNAEAGLREYAGKYQVVNRLFPDLNPETKITHARSTHFTKDLIKRSHQTLHAGDVEEAALMLDVYDDVWQFNDYLRLLKLPDELRKR